MDKSRRLRLPPLVLVRLLDLVFTASSDRSVCDSPAGTEDAGSRSAREPSAASPVSEFWGKGEEYRRGTRGSVSCACDVAAIACDTWRGAGDAPPTHLKQAKAAHEQRLVVVWKLAYDFVQAGELRHKWWYGVV